LITCKLCGTSNEAKSSVCKKCGASLIVRTKQNKSYKKEIYSSRKPQDSFIDIDDGKDLFSSKSKYEQVRKERVLDKIYERELEMGEAPVVPYTVEDPTEKKENEIVKPIQPVVINRQTTSDIVGAKKQQFVPRDTGYGTAEKRKGSNNTNKNKQKNKYNTDHNIPSREIKKVDTQKLAAQQEERRSLTAASVQNNSRRQDNAVCRNTGNFLAAKQAQKDTAEQKTKVIDLEPKKVQTSSDETVKTFERKPKKNNAQNTDVKVYNRHVNNAVSSDLNDKKRSVSPDKVTDKKKSEIKALEKVSAADLRKTENTKKKYSAAQNKTSVSEAEQELLNTVNNSVNDNTSDGFTVQKKEKTAQTLKSEKKAVTVKSADDTAEQTKVKPVKIVKIENTAPVSKPADNTAEQTKVKTVKTVKTENTAPVSKPADNTAEQTKFKTVNTVKTENTAPVSQPADNTAEQTKVKTVNTVKAENTAPVLQPADNTEKQKSVDTAKTSKAKKKVFSDEDIETNKYYASCAYFGILLLVPLMKRKTSRFCRAHTKQGIAVFVYSLIIELVSLLLVLGLRALLVWVLALPYMVYSITMFAVFCAMCVLLVIPAFSGAKNAFNGKYKTVPIAGRLVRKKSKTKNKSKQKKSASTKE